MQALLACKLFTEIDRLYDNHYEALMVLWASNTPSKPQEGVPRKESRSHGRYRTISAHRHFVWCRFLARHTDAALRKREWRYSP